MNNINVRNLVLKYQNNRNKNVVLQYILKEKMNEIIKLNNYKRYIITNNLSGGSFKWINDLNDVKIVNNTKLLNQLNLDNKLIILQSFLFTDINIDNIFKLYNKYNFKIILPIHDWYWFIYPYSNNFTHNIHNKYLNFLPISNQTIRLFNICEKILCPSKFVFDIVSKYTNNAIITEWDDYKVSIIKLPNILPINKVINIGILTGRSECKGREQIDFLYNKYNSYKINFKIIGLNISKYNDTITDFLNHIVKYNIHGLLHLNKWGETYCYALTKSLISGLPILYNNFGAFKDRIPKNIEKYMINNNNENEFFNYKQLETNFIKFIDYIKNNGNTFKLPTNICMKKKMNSIINNIHLGNSNKKTLLKYAVYFPQFHEILENNINFYKGYTDIVNLNNYSDKKETPNLKLLNLNKITDYNLKTNSNLIQKQIDLLVDYNIDGFAMYYYWFSTNTITNKKTIMNNIHQTFLNKNIKNKKIFYIWANENWSDNPAFGSSNHKILNDYNDSDINLHCNKLIKDFQKNNYLKINNKPVFFIHHSWCIPNNKLEKFKNILISKCKDNNFDGLYLKINSMNVPDEIINKKKSDYYQFHPNYKRTKSIKIKNNQIYLDYDKYIHTELNHIAPIQTLFFDFNNRVRLSNPDKLNKSTICINNTEHNMIKYLKSINNFYNKNNFDDQPILLINAWNEWGEKMHIEPSNEKNTYYLDLINKYL